MNRIAYITGDVHYIKDTNIHIDEYKLAERYINIIEQYNAKATLFVTGRCIMKHRFFWNWMAQKPHIELGAHTYKAFNFINKVFDKLNGEPYGNYFYQYLDILRTVRAFKKIDYTPISWRTHSYAGNSDTLNILPKFGFKIISDRVEHGGEIKVNHELVDVPINVLNDDAVLVEMLGQKGIKVFRDTGLKDIQQGVNPIITQFHPLLMANFDDFKTFRTLLEAFVEYGYTFRILKEVIKR